MDGGAAEEAADNTPADGGAGGGGQAADPQVDIKDVVTTDFMKDIIGDLGLDIEKDGLGDLVGEEEKKEEEKKDDGNNNNGGDGKDAAGDK